VPKAGTVFTTIDIIGICILPTNNAPTGNYLPIETPPIYILQNQLNLIASRRNSKLHIGSCTIIRGQMTATPTRRNTEILMLNFVSFHRQHPVYVCNTRKNLPPIIAVKTKIEDGGFSIVCIATVASLNDNIQGTALDNQVLT
jgi:hypothetical protein